MQGLSELYAVSENLLLGSRFAAHISEADQKRQRKEVEEIFRRLRAQPGIILADEVGMGKTFVALAVAFSVAVRNPRGPVIIMVPPNLIEKWQQDLKTFCELYVDGWRALDRDSCADPSQWMASRSLRFSSARHGVELMKLLDDSPAERCHLVFLAQGAMSRQQTDKWVRLALVAESLRRHGRGGAARLIQVKQTIHRYLGRLLWALGEERAHAWGDELWKQLLHAPLDAWKNIYNQAVTDDNRKLNDDPVPKSIERALVDVGLKDLARALETMPIRARGGETRVAERVDHTRTILRQVEECLWKDLLAQAQWRSPLLVMDEAHHLKNPGTRLARQLQSPDTDQDLRTGDGALANAFDRMLFLTATPFQLGHYELVRVLERFGDVRWNEEEMGKREHFSQRMSELARKLDDSQRVAITLQRTWNRLSTEDLEGEVELWWRDLLETPRDQLNYRQRAVIEAYETARRLRAEAEQALAPWIVRHNKGVIWANSDIPRRRRLEGAVIVGRDRGKGLHIPPDQLLPFFLAARSAVSPGQDLLGEALSSSYEAFRHTRESRQAAKDEEDEEDEVRATPLDLSSAGWYLGEFDRALQTQGGATHPKVSVTVKTVVDLWEKGEKVLIFAFYRQTCRYLRIHISREIERRMIGETRRRLPETAEYERVEDIHVISTIQRRYFDDTSSPGRRAVDTALQQILASRSRLLEKTDFGDDQKGAVLDVMRRFLRVATTLIRSFPLEEFDSMQPDNAVSALLDHQDESGVSWRCKFEEFIEFLTDRCSPSERAEYRDAAQRIQTRAIRVQDDDTSAESGDGELATLANVQVVTGETARDHRARLMRAFNMPFFPDILVCSEVMSEGVDLQRYCRHVIHHDLAWNPSTIEQRTGRIDRIGCKAEGRHSINIYLPYISGAADERQYKVMADREQWFRVVMGQDEVAKLITPDAACPVPLPATVAEELSFNLGLEA